MLGAPIGGEGQVLTQEEELDTQKSSEEVEVWRGEVPCSRSLS